jgi:hypothetical protein
MKIHCLICGKWVSVTDKSLPCPECGLRMCGLEDLGAELPEYEAETAREVVRWMNIPPGAVSEGINKIVDGIASGVGMAVPQTVAEEVTKQVTTLLEFLQDLSYHTIIFDEQALRAKLERVFGEGRIAQTLTKVLPLVSGKGVVQQARELGYQVSSVSDLRRFGLVEVDKIVSHGTGFSGSSGLAALEGFFTGLGELALFVLDILAITAINFCSVQRIATCFGYDQDVPQEKIVTMRIFAASFGGEFTVGTDVPAKIMAAYELRALAYAVRQNWSSAQMAEKERLGAILGWLKTIAPRQLAKYVTSRKAAALMPLVGAGIGAAINYILTVDTGKSGWYYYRYRKLLEDFGGLEGEKTPSVPFPVGGGESVQ